MIPAPVLQSGDYADRPPATAPNPHEGKYAVETLPVLPFYPAEMT